MFQLGSLVVFYGLLIGTSESLLSNVGSVLDTLKVPSPASGDALKNLNANVESLTKGANVESLTKAANVESLAKATDWLSVKDNIVGALNTLDTSKLNLHFSQGGLGLEIKKFNFLNLQADLSSDLKGINLKLPIVVDASVILPLLGSLVDLSVSLDLITSLTVQTNAQTGLPTLTIGKCSSDADKISISLLGRRNPFVNRILDSASGLITNIVTHLLQNQICPVLQFLLENLNVNLTQNLVSNLLIGQLPVPI